MSICDTCEKKFIYGDVLCPSCKMKELKLFVNDATQYPADDIARVLVTEDIPYLMWMVETLVEERDHLKADADFYSSSAVPAKSP